MYEDLTKKKFNLLTVVRLYNRNRHGQIIWECLCECGKYAYVTTQALKASRSKSCGCYKTFISKLNLVTHGHTVDNRCSGEYKSWSGMKSRCYSKNNPDYKDYGQMGVIVCDRWLNSFEHFILDMGLKPSKQHSIDRYPDKNGNYEPSNCRWATKAEQSRNRRCNRLYLYNETQYILEDLALKLGTFPSNILRMMKTKSLEDVISYYENRDSLTKK